MVVLGTNGEDAYQIVQGPLMTLIGGSLVIAKNLVNLDKDDDKDS